MSILRDSLAAETWRAYKCAVALATMLERRNNEVARAAGATKVTLYFDNQVITKAEDVEEVVDTFVYAGPRTLTTSSYSKALSSSRDNAL